MNINQTRNAIDKRFSMLNASLLLLAFAAALGLRVAIGRPQVAQSAVAGLSFALCLIGLSFIAGVQIRWSWRAVLVGLAGGLALCVPALLAHWLGHRELPAAHGYVSWVIAASIVAFSEELFLRGALFDALTKWKGEFTAVLIGALAFALLHAPLYGWHVVLLDFGVGIFLGSLRLFSGSFIAPGIAHVVADLAGWWLR